MAFESQQAERFGALFSQVLVCFWRIRLRLSEGFTLGRLGGRGCALGLAEGTQDTNGFSEFVARIEEGKEAGKAVLGLFAFEQLQEKKFAAVGG